MNLKPIKADKELHLLILSLRLLQAYFKDTNTKSDLIIGLYASMERICRMYKSRWNYILSSANIKLNAIESKAKAFKDLPAKNKYDRKIAIDEDNHLVVHPLSLAVCLILAHKDMDNTSLKADYPLALKIYEDLNISKDDAIVNSRMVSNYFAEMI